MLSSPRNYSGLRKRRLVIFRGHLGKSFRVHEPANEVGRLVVCLRTIIDRVLGISPNRQQKVNVVLTRTCEPMFW